MTLLPVLAHDTDKRILLKQWVHHFINFRLSIAYAASVQSIFEEAPFSMLDSKLIPIPVFCLYLNLPFFLFIPCLVTFAFGEYTPH
jgi:hypothetical protein